MTFCSTESVNLLWACTFALTAATISFDLTVKFMHVVVTFALLCDTVLFLDKCMYMVKSDSWSDTSHCINQMYHHLSLFLHSLWLLCPLQLWPAGECVHLCCAGSPDCRLAPCCAMQSHTLPPSSYFISNTDPRKEKHIHVTITRFI